jgi:hypothetical protein
MVKKELPTSLDEIEEFIAEYDRLFVGSITIYSTHKDLKFYKALEKVYFVAIDENGKLITTRDWRLSTQMSASVASKLEPLIEKYPEVDWCLFRGGRYNDDQEDLYKKKLESALDVAAYQIKQEEEHREEIKGKFADFRASEKGAQEVVDFLETLSTAYNEYKIPYYAIRDLLEEGNEKK